MVCRNIFLSFKMSPPDDFISSNVEIPSITILEVTGWNEIELIVMYLLLIFVILGWFLYLLTILLIRYVSLNFSNKKSFEIEIQSL